jgi:uncharacterized protein (UPF0254 family)
MDPISLAISAIPSVIQAGVGIGQSFAGKRQIKKLDRPEYTMSKEFEDNLRLAQIAATEGLDAASENLMRQGVERQTQTALTQGSERGAGFMGLGGLMDSQNQNFLRMTSMDAEIRRQARQDVMKAKSDIAAEKEKEFMINKLDPYTQKLESSQALIGAGMQNVMGGMTNLAKAGTAAINKGYSFKQKKPIVPAFEETDNYEENQDGE